jgi:hypothetical protein
MVDVRCGVTLSRPELFDRNNEFFKVAMRRLLNRPSLEVEFCDLSRHSKLYSNRGRPPLVVI